MSSLIVAPTVGGDRVPHQASHVCLTWAGCRVMVAEKVGPGWLSTVIVTPVEVALLFEVSLATAVKVWLPFVRLVVLKEMEYGAVVSSAPILEPSTWNWTPATATLSEALAETVMVAETVEPGLGAVIETVGGVVSEEEVLSTVTFTPAEVVLLFEVSLATAVKVWVPLATPVVFQETE